MATPAHNRLIQDQNLNILYGTTPGPKTDDVAKADKRGGLGARKALNDISNSRKPSALHSVKKDSSMSAVPIENDPFHAVKAKISKASEKRKVGRKALGDLTNSVKPPVKLVPGARRKSSAFVEENVPSCIMEERFLHSHQECIKAQMKPVDMDYFLKSVGLNNDNAALPPSARRTLPLSSKKHESNSKCLQMEEIPEQHVFEDRVVQSKKPELLPGFCSPVCRSPQSPKAPYMKWEEEEDDFSDLSVIETPKLV